MLFILFVERKRGDKAKTSLSIVKNGGMRINILCHYTEKYNLCCIFASKTNMALAKMPTSELWNAIKEAVVT